MPLFLPPTAKMHWLGEWYSHIMSCSVSGQEVLPRNAPHLFVCLFVCLFIYLFIGYFLVGVGRRRRKPCYMFVVLL